MRCQNFYCRQCQRHSHARKCWYIQLLIFHHPLAVWIITEVRTIYQQLQQCKLTIHIKSKVNNSVDLCVSPKAVSTLIFRFTNSHWLAIFPQHYQKTTEYGTYRNILARTIATSHGTRSHNNPLTLICDLIIRRVVLLLNDWSLWRIS